MAWEMSAVYVLAFVGGVIALLLAVTMGWSVLLMIGNGLREGWSGIKKPEHFYAVTFTNGEYVVRATDAAEATRYARSLGRASGGVQRVRFLSAEEGPIIVRVALAGTVASPTTGTQTRVSP